MTMPEKDLHVKVFVRVRPSTTESHTQNVVLASEDKNQIMLQTEEKRTFIYDGVFEQTASQSDVFCRSIKPMLNNYDMGYNVSVIAYGQTGSGKTYTMGTNFENGKANEGIVQKCLQTMLESSEQQENTVNNDASNTDLSMSFIEIYSESAFDLLSETKEPLTFKHDLAGLVPTNCTMVNLKSIDQSLEVLEKGIRNRSVASTIKNANSSRSHSVLTIYSRKTKATLKLIDLAGAEGVGRNQQEGKEFSEGVAINQSLLALGKVLSALSNGAKHHISYRESLLTRILQESFGGNCYTSMIACVSPNKSDVHVTLSTLRYATQACSIKVKPMVFSTVKKKNPFKRVLAATPNTWTKKNSDQFLNSTIASPGYKPSTIKKPKRLNSTFMQPFSSHSRSTLVKRKLTSSHMNLVSPPPFDPQNVLDSKFSENPTIEFSPFIDKMQSRLEQSMMEKLESLEDRVAEKVAKILDLQNRRRSMRLKSKEEHGSSENMETDIKRLALNELESFKEDLKPVFDKDGTLSQDPISPQNKTLRRSRRLTSTSKLSPISKPPRKSRVVTSSPKFNTSLNKSFDPETVFQKVRRNPTRKSAVVANRRNFDIFNGKSPKITPKLKKKLNDTSFKERFSAQTPKAHEEIVLSILNRGNIRELQKLPTIGPKTALILHNYSKFYGPLKQLPDLKKIDALPKSFYQRFLMANMIET